MLHVHVYEWEIVTMHTNKNQPTQEIHVA